MNLDRTILSITDPTIILDELKIEDERTTNNGDIAVHKALGDIIPLVKVNNYYFRDSELIDFKIESTEFQPRIRVTVLITDGVFISSAYPKDGDLISIFIRTKLKDFRAIRADFEITGTKMSPSTDSSGEISFVTLEGVLRIPGLYGEICKVFKDSTSFDTLMDIATDLKLGYASNEVKTDDIMNWICGFDTYHKFINDVTDFSYKNDNSFYQAFIDWYYYLNFVNVNNQFTSDETFDDGIIQSLLHTDIKTDSKETPSSKSKLYLTNLSKLKGTNMFIQNYSLINKSGSISMENGYRRHIQFYDVNNKKYETFFIDPLATPGSEKKVILKGRPNEDTWKQRIKYKWMGNQYSSPKHNVHSNYFYAQVQNHQNNIEIEKLTLNVQLQKANWNLYRYQRIPLVIMNEGNKNRIQLTKGSDEEQKGSVAITHDKFLSGFYVILGIVYSWDRQSGWSQELRLSKREWDAQ